MTKLFVYYIDAIDFWPGWMQEAAYLQSLSASDYDGTSFASAYNSLKAKALVLAKQVGWEGDIRGDIMVAGIPSPSSAGDGEIMIAWKQNNNGDTLVATPFEMPHLAKVAHKFVVG